LLKMGIKGTTMLMLLGTVVGGLAVTNASATASTTSKKITSEFDKVGMRNLPMLTRSSDSRTVAGSLAPDVFTLGSALNVANENRKKSVKIGTGSVVEGEIDDRGLAAVKNMVLSKKNQKKVWRVIGNKWQYSGSMEKLNSAAQKSFQPHVAKTAFAYGAYSNLPDLYRVSSSSKYDMDKGSRHFITVTADNYLNVYTNYMVKPKNPANASTPNYTNISQSVKIKKFTRGKSTFAYYLAKPLKGFGTKRVRVGKSTRYLLKMSLGKVFQARDNVNGDAGTFRITVKVGTQKYYANLGNIAESYADLLEGNNYGAYSFDEQAAKTYVQTLQ